MESESLENNSLVYIDIAEDINTEDKDEPLDVYLFENPKKQMNPMDSSNPTSAEPKSPTIRKRKKTRTPESFWDEKDLEHLRKPFKYGWKREIVYRNTFGSNHKLQADVYYITPKGKKLRSLVEISGYLDGSNDANVNLTHFTLRKTKIFHPPEEIERSAGKSWRKLNDEPDTSPTKDQAVKNDNVLPVKRRKRKITPVKKSQLQDSLKLKLKSTEKKRNSDAEERCDSEIHSSHEPPSEPVKSVVGDISQSNKAMQTEISNEFEELPRKKLKAPKKIKHSETVDIVQSALESPSKTIASILRDTYQQNSAEKLYTLGQSDQTKKGSTIIDLSSDKPSSICINKCGAICLGSSAFKHCHMCRGIHHPVCSQFFGLDKTGLLCAKCSQKPTNSEGPKFVAVPSFPTQPQPHGYVLANSARPLLMVRLSRQQLVAPGSKSLLFPQFPNASGIRSEPSYLNITGSSNFSVLGSTRLRLPSLNGGSHETEESKKEQGCRNTDNKHQENTRNVQDSSDCIDHDIDKSLPIAFELPEVKEECGHYTATDLKVTFSIKKKSSHDCGNFMKVTTKPQKLLIPSAAMILNVNNQLTLNIEGKKHTVISAEKSMDNDVELVFPPDSFPEELDNPLEATLSCECSLHAIKAGIPKQRNKVRNILKGFNILNLSYSVMMTILKHLSVKDLLRLTYVCKSCRDLALQPCLWQELHLKDLTVRNWKLASNFFIKVNVNKLDMTGLKMRLKSWDHFIQVIPAVKNLKGIVFQEVPAFVLDTLTQAMPDLTTVSVISIIEDNELLSNSRSFQSENILKSCNSMDGRNVATEEQVNCNQSKDSFSLTRDEENALLLCCMRLSQMGFTVQLSTVRALCLEMCSRQSHSQQSMAAMRNYCRILFFKNVSLLNTVEDSDADILTKLKSHFTSLSRLLPKIPLEANQILVFDLQTYTVYLHGNPVNVTGLSMMSPCPDKSLHPTMLVVPILVKGSHLDLIITLEQNGMATSKIVTDYINLVTKEIKKPIFIVFNGLHMLSEKFIASCISDSTYLYCVTPSVARYVFPGSLAGPLHSLKTYVELRPRVSLQSFITFTIMLIDKNVKLRQDVKQSFIATGLFPFNPQAPHQYHQDLKPSSQLAASDQTLSSDKNKPTVDDKYKMNTSKDLGNNSVKCLSSEKRVTYLDDKNSKTLDTLKLTGSIERNPYPFQKYFNDKINMEKVRGEIFGLTGSLINSSLPQNDQAMTFDSRFYVHFDPLGVSCDTQSDSSHRKLDSHIEKVRKNNDRLRTLCKAKKLLKLACKRLVQKNSAANQEVKLYENVKLSHFSVQSQVKDNNCLRKSGCDNSNADQRKRKLSPGEMTNIDLCKARKIVAPLTPGLKQKIGRHSLVESYHENAGEEYDSKLSQSCSISASSVIVDQSYSELNGSDKTGSVTQKCYPASKHDVVQLYHSNKKANQSQQPCKSNKKLSNLSNGENQTHLTNVSKLNNSVSAKVESSPESVKSLGNLSVSDIHADFKSNEFMSSSLILDKISGYETVVLDILKDSLHHLSGSDPELIGQAPLLDHDYFKKNILNDETVSDLFTFTDTSCDSRDQMCSSKTGATIPAVPLSLSLTSTYSTDQSSSLKTDVTKPDNKHRLSTSTTKQFSDIKHCETEPVDEPSSSINSAESIQSVSEGSGSSIHEESEDTVNSSDYEQQPAVKAKLKKRRGKKKDNDAKAKCQICFKCNPPLCKEEIIDWVDCDANCGRWFHVICIKRLQQNIEQYHCAFCQ